MNIQDGTTSLAERIERLAEPVPIRAPDLSNLPGSASLLEALSIGVYVCDVAGLIVRFNQKAVELWGRTPKLSDTADRYCGSWRLHRVDGGPLAHADCPMADVLRTGEPVLDQEVVIERPDGSRITALANIVALRDATGAITGAVNCLLDITQRKRSEAALRESESGLSRELAAATRLQEISALLIQEGNVDALYDRILDAAIALMHSDMASMQMLDHGRDELRLLAWKGFHPESAGFWEWVHLDSGSTCGAALSSGQRVVVPDIEASDLIVGTPDFDAYRKSDIRAVQSTPLVSRSGRLLGMISTHWRKPHQPAERDLRLLDVLARQAADLLERAQAEAALRESERRSRALIEALPAAIYTTDAAGRITFYNQAAVEFSGRRPEIGNDKWCVSWRLYWPDGRPMPHDECPMAVALREGRPVRGAEAIAERPDGTRVHFVPYPTPLRDASGAVVGAVNMLVDITDRRVSEATMRESEERYRGLAEAIAAVVWTTDADGQVDDMSQWRALTGQSRQDVRGWGWLDAIHPDDRALTREIWTRAVKMQIPCDMEYRIRTASGAYRWYNARGVPVLADDGTLREWVGVCIDITGRKQAEDKAKLLAREVNHRANNLLTIINAMMRQTRAQTAAELIRAMQGRISALARVQTRLARDQWDRTDLLKLVGEELAPFGKDIAGRFEISGPPVPLSADAAQALAIVVHELATNAVKYGALSASAGKVSIAWGFAKERLVLSWTETGGPAVSAPSREGFGTRAIALLTQQLEGDVQLEWTQAGLACELGIPAKNLDDGALGIS